jgi:hypothetical protein
MTEKIVNDDDIFKNSHLNTVKMNGKQLKLPDSIYSLFFVSVLDYDKVDSNVKKRGWLDKN